MRDTAKGGPGTTPFLRTGAGNKHLYREPAERRYSRRGFSE